MSTQFTKIQPRAYGQETFLNLAQMDDYPVFSKFIDTQDGYIINILRIPGPRGESLVDAFEKSVNREPVILLHGIFGSADGYVQNGPELSLAYILANTGRYDLWFMNARGNLYSLNHNLLDSESSKEFWQFSFDEVGTYDLEATVNYVLQVTGKQKVTLLGYSQGTTTILSALAMN